MSARHLLLAATTLPLALALALAACHRTPPEEKPSTTIAADAGEHVDEREHEALPRRVKLTPEVVAAAKIRTAPAVKEVLAPTLSLPGEIVADPDKSARVSSPVAGRVTRVAFQEGSAVRKGDLLATVRVPELGKIRAAYAATGVKAGAARSNADRLQALAEKKLAGTQEALTAKAEADSLEAETRALDEQLRGMGTGTSGGGADLVLRAPVAGVVVTRNAVVGQPVTAEEIVASIADLSEVWFLARVFEKDLGRLQAGAKADVQLNAYPKQRFDGSVEYLGRQIDPIARTVTARIRLTNREDVLRIGLFGTARVATGEAGTHDATLVVPRDAVTEIAGKPAVFVKQPDGDFELHDVLLGEGALGKVQIVRGLREGEQVVVDGVFTLKSAVLKSTFGEQE
jgi:membrane fusion protein, heavy metal efflux system